MVCRNLFIGIKELMFFRHNNVIMAQKRPDLLKIHAEIFTDEII